MIFYNLRSIRFFVVFVDPITGERISGLPIPGQLPPFTTGGLGAFGLSNIRVGMTGEVERARLDILERMKRTTDSRAKSRLTLPRLLGDGKTEKNILADVL